MKADIHAPDTRWPARHGKTTIAKALAKRLGAVHVRVDTIEQAIRDTSEVDRDIGAAGYVVAYNVAEDNLTVGNTVIADSVNALRITREAWLAVAERAGVRAVEIEVICSDKAEHRRRAETRVTDVEGLIKPSWDKIVTRHYEDWGSSPIVIDTAASDPAAVLSNLMAKLMLD
jgi:hypothetical protein